LKVMLIAGIRAVFRQTHKKMVKVEAGMNEAVFFDLDKTISAVPTEKYFAYHLFKKNIISTMDFIKVIWQCLMYDLHFTRDFYAVKSNVIRIVMRDQCAVQMKDVYREYFHNFLRGMIFPQMLMEIKRHRLENRRLVIISASLDFIVEEFCAYLDIDHFYASNLEIVNERYTGETLGKIYMGRTKHDAVKEYAEIHNVDLSRSYAYGDYAEDSHILRMVGFPVAVNPDKKLLSEAVKYNWEIQNCQLSA